MANEIVPGLWIGGVRAAKNLKFLRDNNIQVIVNATRDIPNYYQNSDYPVFYKRVPVDDSLLYSDVSSMKYYLPNVVNFIETELEKGKNILIHCQSGMQRSPIIAAAYVLKTKNLTPTEALKFVVAKHPQAFFYGTMPNFEKALISYHQKLHQ